MFSGRRPSSYDSLIDSFASTNRVISEFQIRVMASSSIDDIFYSANSGNSGSEQSHSSLI